MRLLVVGLGHLSKGDVSIAADLARQLPRPPFRVGFVATADVVPQLRDLGLPAVALDAGSPEGNLVAFDRLVASFRPDLVLAADAFTLNYSVGWSGLSMSVLRERYDVRLGSVDQYEWDSTGFVVDFYGDNRMRFPDLLADCDLLIRNCPLNRPAASSGRVAVAPLLGGAPRDTPSRRGPRESSSAPTVFLVNSPWEYVNAVKSPRLDRLIEAVPRIVHSHLAAAGRPLRVVHVGPRAWDFPVADSVDYRHYARLPPGTFHEQLTGARLFITANAASVTLSQAVLAGVPALLLQNHKILDVRRLGADAPRWLAEAAPELDLAHPFRVVPWGWHDFLAPVLADNPYTGCFREVGIFERSAVVGALGELLDGGPARAAMRDRQLAYRELLAALPPPAAAFEAVAAR